MDTSPNSIACAHKDAEKTGQACEHLLKKANDEYYTSSEHFRYFTGRGAEFVLLCADCAKKANFGRIHWRTICNWCVQDMACGDRLGEIGRPEIRRRETGLALSHRSAGAVSTSIAAACPLGQQKDGRWLLLTANCELVVLSPADKSQKRLAVPIPQNLDREQPLMLTVSNDGRFVAVANTYGRNAVVIDVESERIVIELVRGNYYNEHCKFPVAFAEQDGQPLVAHATDWNRLDISDLASGKLLTSREPTSFSRGQNRPAHYLDYFQCGLSVSPNSEWIASNGWVWSPVGYIASWSLSRWLTENVWESEDGPSKRALCHRDYYWDGPVCWIDNDQLAVWGLGDDEIVLIPGVRIFDVRSGQETNSFAGPVGGSIPAIMHIDGKERHFRFSEGKLVFDQWLFSWMEGKPFSIWDVKDGACLLEEPDFTPINYHRGTKEFLSRLPDGTIRLSVIISP